ncbi:MAG TPA: VIT1/CCC1 transporter family protein [bacterium]|jgi:VIT1/CCC1 family predicted Fe2+/Mn2+ transporter
MHDGASDAQLKIWHEHWQDEGDAAFLYRQIVARETDPRRTRVFSDLAKVEDQHLQRWADVLRQVGVQLTPHRPSLRARMMALIGRFFGWRLLASLLLSEEGRETKGYLRGAETYGSSEASETAADLAKESAEHAEQLGELLGVSGEPWHRTASGGFLRNAVYGFNDGLTANFGLVMGVLGASVPHHIILVSGVAGLFADALSMGSSGFLAAKSEREVYEHEIAVEREELRLMPDLEETELALLYETRGLDAREARRAAAQVMENPDRALREKTQLELGIAEATMSPLREGWITGLATAVGAFIPVFPFIIMRGPAAIWTAFSISMLSHFGVGAARSIFTGRGAFRSGLDMFIVGLGIAGIGYLVGEWISRML